MNTASIWNIEFELHRKFLKQIAVESCIKLFNNLKSIWFYLTNKWFVMLDENSKPEDRIISKEWGELQSAFQNYKGNSFISRKLQISCKIDSLVVSAMGYLTSYSALTGLIDPSDTLKSLIEDGMNNFEKRGKDYKEIAYTKSRLFAVGGVSL